MPSTGRYGAQSAALRMVAALSAVPSVALSGGGCTAAAVERQVVSLLACLVSLLVSGEACSGAKSNIFTALDASNRPL